MLKNYFKITIRNLFRNKNYTILNISGLALGMSVAILIALWIHDELSFNKYHKNYEHIAKVYRKNDTGMTSQIVTTGMGTLLKSEYSSFFEHIVLVRQRLEQRLLTFKDKGFTQGGYFMQPEGPEMLILKMVYGTRDGLDDLRSILLSESLAQKLFGDINPVNQVVKMDTEWALKVTGVYEDLPLNSEFNDATYFAPLDLYLYGWSDLNTWDNYNMRLYVQIHPETSFEQVSAAIKNAILPYVDPNEAEVHPELFLHPMEKWHLHSKFENGRLVTSERLLVVWFLGLAGLFVLVLACINFINLSTACSEKRVKEIGIRKTLGSSKKNLIFQFLGESFFLSILAFIVSLAIIEALLPIFNELVAKNLALPWTSRGFWLAAIALTIATSMLAGSYPALYLSSFNPTKALKGTALAGRGTILPRTILVVLQFTASIILIIGSLVVYEHIRFVKDRPVGYSKEGLIALRPDVPGNKYDILRNALKATGAVSEITESNYTVTNTYGWNGGFDWEGRDPGYYPSFNIVKTNSEYGKTIGLQFVEGRNFSRELASDKSGVLINESALKLIALKNPVGKILSLNNSDFPYKKYTILGVVKDIVKGSPYDETVPSIIFLSEADLRFVYVRINPAVCAGEALASIKATFNKVLPSIPFEYDFVDAIHNAKFKAEERTGKLSALAAIFAIFISCLGLFGLSSFMVERRTREIGVRKAVGASVFNILSLFTANFTKSVLVANLIAWPIAWYAMNKWLENFAYRIEMSWPREITITEFLKLLIQDPTTGLYFFFSEIFISRGWWMFALAGGLALVIALLSVSWQAVRAATANPVEALRYE